MSNVAFHIGRGGRFNNGGYKSFIPYITTLGELFDKTDMLIDTDDNGKPLSPDECKLISGGGVVLLEGMDNISSETGVIERDGIYNTDIVKAVEDCNDEEVEILYKEYIHGRKLAEDAIEYVCSKKGIRRILSVEYGKTSATIRFTDSTCANYHLTDNGTNLDEIGKWMEDNDIDPVSIEEYVYDIEEHFNN